jgi:CRP/FNR family transcriptional regulator, cyclic AMP receptor protein
MPEQGEHPKPGVNGRISIARAGLLNALPNDDGPSSQSGYPLVGIGLFDTLDPAIRHQLISLAQPRRYTRGEVVFTAGSVSDELLLLMSGTVILFRGRRVGQRAVLAVVRAPGVLGEEVLAGEVPRAASAEAVRDSFALALPSPDLAGLMRRHTAIGDSARWWLVRQLARLAEQHADDILLDLPGRLAKTLIGFADDNLSAVIVDISQSALAGLVRGSRQSVNQTLKGFATRGWLHVEPNRIVITDMGAVRRRAGMDDK